MTVKELIEQLQQIENQDQRVIIRGIDPTDWTYYNDIDDVTPSLLGGDEEKYEIREEDIDEDDDEFFESVEPVVILDGGMF